MAANRKALEYLPEGADLNALTYDQLIAWVQGRPSDRRAQVRLPGRSAGPEAPLLPGLPAARLYRIHRHQVPLGRGRGRRGRRSRSSGSTPTRPRPTTLHAGAAADRGRLDRLRPHRAPRRRLQPAARRLRRLPGARPARWAAASCRCSPASPCPRRRPTWQAKELVNYMLQPETQVATLRPPTSSRSPTRPARRHAGIRPALGPAVTAMTSASDALPALLPVGLGDLGRPVQPGLHRHLRAIVLGGQDIRDRCSTQQAEVLRALMTTPAPPAGLPDAPSDGPCPVD
jgi:multiple sugar transport system substrate-binding protein